MNLEISLVIPVFNEEKNIEVLYTEICRTMAHMNKNNNFEIIFIDDGSHDNSFEVISELNRKDFRVKGLSLSRNFGHQSALSAGLEHTSGDIIIMLDGDLQHPPAVIAELYNKYLEGYDIVNTKRINKYNSIFKSFSSKYFYKILNSIAEIKIEENSSDFRLINKKVLNAFSSIKEKNRFIRGLIGYLGFKQTTIEYQASNRYAGESKYTLKKMFNLAINGITSFSAKPLRISLYAGLFLFILGTIYLIFALISHAKGQTMPGWTSLVLIIIFMGGLQLLGLGIIGEYIAQIFEEVKARPVYFLKNKTPALNLIYEELPNLQRTALCIDL